MTDDDPLARVARAILDGTAVDWAAVDEGAAGRQDVVKELRLIERLAEASRGLEQPARWHHLEIRDCLGEGTYGACIAPGTRGSIVKWR